MFVEVPGTGKLSGEHFVVHGAWGLAVGLQRKVRVEATPIEQANFKDSLRVVLRDFSITKEIDGRRVDSVFSDYRTTLEKVKNEKEPKEKQKLFASFIGGNSDLGEKVLPYAIIAGRLETEGISVLGYSFDFRSDIIPQMGLASSGSCYTAFAALGCLLAKKSLTPAVFIDVAREGERITHRSATAGGIDVSTSASGGYVKFRNDIGTIKESIATRLKLVLINSGSKPPTSVPVAIFSEFRIKNPERVAVLDPLISNLTLEMISALKADDLQTAGHIMFQEQEIFNEVGVSSPSLEKGRKLAEDYKALGYKMTGGGMGGYALGLAQNPEDFARFMSRNGFPSEVVEVSTNGVLKYFEDNANYL